MGLISAILGAVAMLVGWLARHLPLSPFANMRLANVTLPGGYTVEQVLAWVNWLVPFRDMANIFSTWLTAVIVVSVVMIVKRSALKIGTNGVLGDDAK